MTQPAPKSLLHDILWRCEAKRYPAQDLFEQEVREYHEAILGDAERWRPDEVALEAPRVRVSFMCWTPDERQIDALVELEANDGARFTTGELMHQLCDELGAYLLENDCKLYDHCFFEGLSKASDEPLTYYIYFGS